MKAAPQKTVLEGMIRMKSNAKIRGEQKQCDCEYGVRAESELRTESTFTAAAKNNGHVCFLQKHPETGHDVLF